MLKSKIQIIDNKPFININNSLHTPLAYTTYFDECGEWTDFIKSGYKMFFVNVSFTDLPINNTSGFTPFRTGVFETETPDYSEFDEIVRNIVAECPDAFIFPRINISMPRKWIEDNPHETVTTDSGPRESLYSDLFMKDGAELLKTLVAHIRSADYSGRIAGYQLCGGTTQEWMHYDLFGSYSEMGMKKFCQWCSDKYGIKDIKIPEREDFDKGILTYENQKYYEFCNEMPSKTIEHFAKALKDFINNEQIVGVFYGYSAFVCDCLWGLHGLGNIIDSPYIDFFSSPCCYDFNREFGVDWGDMIPADSLKHHKKLYFVECDIRTHLTKRMQDSRPNEYSDNILLLVDSNGNKTVWSGPPSLELSISAIRKAFAHQITKGSGIWWFDMWGGWYHHSDIMGEIEKFRDIYEALKTKPTKNSPSAEVALFVDENAYRNIPRGNHLLNMVNHIRVKLGTSGIPFDIFMVEDAPKVIHKYKSVIFSAPVPSEIGKKAIELCKTLNIPFISTNEDSTFRSTDELRDLLISFGVHCYNNDGCVIYCGNGILAIHTVNDGKAEIMLPKKFKIKSLLGVESDEYGADKITLDLPKHSTAIFELEDIVY